MENRQFISQKVEPEIKNRPRVLSESLPETKVIFDGRAPLQGSFAEQTEEMQSYDSAFVDAHRPTKME